MIKTVEVTNFKSFDRLRVELGPLCALVGANASGKTNFIDIFRFIQDALREDVSVAVSRRMGPKGVRCRRLYSKNTSIGLSLEPRDPEYAIYVEYFRPPSSGEKGLMPPPLVAHLFKYAFRFEYENGGVVVSSEDLEATLGERPREEGAESAERKAGFWRRGLKIRQEPQQREEWELPRERRDTLFLAAGAFSTAAARLEDIVRNWTFYHIDAGQARAPRLAQSVVKLTEDAANLPLLLEQLNDVEDKESAARGKRVRDLMQSMVPGFESWKTERTYDGRIAFRVREAGTRSTFPPELLSDGTVTLLALLVALIAPTEAPETVFIEEPEGRLHPQLMESLVDLMRQVSTRTQVIVTTHSPDLVRHLRAHEVYMVDKLDRATKIVRASTVDQVEQFLEQFSMDELWMQGYLQSGLPI